MAEAQALNLEYEIRCGQARIRLGTTPLTVGRSPECEIVLDSIAVSRRHARLGFRGGAPVVSDLGSANGVFVNGRRVNGEQTLSAGDIVVVGDQELSLSASRVEMPPISRTAETVASADTLWNDDGENEGPEGNTDVQDAVELLGAVAVRFMDAGDALKAAEVLQPRLAQLLERARSGRLKPEVAENAGTNAIRLALALGDARWVDYVIQLYSIFGQMLPEALLVAMHDAIRKLPRIELVPLHDYMEQMASAELSSHERFLLKRLDGLARVASLR